MINASDSFRSIRELAPEALRFSEAYPRLDSVKAQHAWRAGKTVCRWIAPGRGLGSLQIERVEAGERPAWLSATYRIVDKPAMLPYTEGAATFDLEVIACGHMEMRWYFRCPVCKERKKILVFGRSSACARCHGLHSRSQLVGTKVRRQERCLELVRLLRHGRPKGMHQVKCAASSECATYPDDWTASGRLPRQEPSMMASIAPG
jgi:ssDNA-binding Zn-finger/Zn-ribbon topoisomerase 1